ncbi:MAG: SAM-dependent methyltransferase [Opitutaceae bacterium]
MATQRQIEALYDWLDRFQELRLGRHADITCALFDGDRGKTLRRAQQDKHEWILRTFGFRPGQKLLDIGCGWGPMLKAVRDRSGSAVGLTLSGAQAEACARDGLDARLLDYKVADPAALHMFDAVVSIGALEHFCSEEEYLAGRQDEIYRQFFRFCAAVLRPGGWLYVQTMLWGKRVPDPAVCSLACPPSSDELVIARLRKFYPGSWLPRGKDQLIACARPFFEFQSSNNGRKDYIETLERWGRATRGLLFPPRLLQALRRGVGLVPRWLSDPEFRVQIASLRHNDQQQCFVREIMTHERMFFRKGPASPGQPDGGIPSLEP